jgi:hypothetical protein
MKLAKIIAMATLLVTSVAQAGGYTQVEYSTEENRNTNKEAIKLGVIGGIKTTEGWDYSFKLESGQTELGNGSISDGVEVRVRKNFNKIGFVTPMLGVRLGQKITSSTHFGHYAVDGALKFPLFGSFKGEVGARYRDTFDTENLYQSTRGHVTLGYALTKQDDISIRFAKAYGDTSEEKDSWRLQYTRSF